jgi:DMSO reductase anchor subunit
MSSWSLTCFTLLTQSAVGLVFIGTVGHWFGGAVQAEISLRSMALALGLTGAGLLAALTHLAAPRLAPYALRNPVTSWLSREVLLVPIFAVALVLALVAARMGGPGALVLVELAALISGGAALWAMTGVYLLKTVPAWNTPATILEFIGSALLLGGALSAVSTSFGAATGRGTAFTTAVIGMCLGLAIKLAAIYPGLAAERSTRDQVWYQPPAASLSAAQSRVLRSVLNATGIALILSTVVVDSVQVGISLGLIIIVTGEIMGRLRFYRLYGRIGL